MLDLRYGNSIEAGCDEAGRGCLAGPVVAAAVILPANFESEHLNDSKKLSENKRKTLEIQIKAQSLSWAIGVVDHIEIDKINILNASIKAMHKAISDLKIAPQFLLIDGNRFHKYKNIEHCCFVKGDGKYMSIAAASILAKTHRDALMKQMHERHPDYGWDRNKGYPTIEHRKAIVQIGPSPFHRKSFKLTDPQMKLF